MAQASIDDLPWDQRVALDAALEALSLTHEDFRFRIEDGSWLSQNGVNPARITVERLADGKVEHYSFADGETNWTQRLVHNFAA
ncbi:hypothetical protein [Silvimonas sp.]|uniref:hypothetical protein n=1 Tax=Silvimonas sp. TaxID=2650811 RepID=UPI00284E1926|nr:hypothetical protein [Silvimonas sp.]MDR3429128.1 hypothetical protein [Silvimonas sp.]